jgi:steroid delta-isomerase-like uncharacterized protein
MLRNEIDMLREETVAANRATVSRFLAGTHGGDLAVIDETVSEGIVTHGFPGGNPASREQYKQWFRSFGAAFSNMRFETTVTVADETHVAVRWRVTVDHSGAFAGVPATGRRVSFDGVAIYRLERGLIAETWLHVDEFALLTQIGAAPAMLAA